jgi:acyl-CoA synthetase (AMP-forming)/AMP-acid ligase II
MNLNGADVWGHFAPLFHLVDVFAVYAITLVGGRHVLLPAFSAPDVLLAIGAPPAPAPARAHAPAPRSADPGSALLARRNCHTHRLTSRPARPPRRPAERERVSVTNMASTMVAMLVSNPLGAQLDLASLRVLSCGGSPQSPAVVRRAIALLGCEFFVSYGMTECCGKISMSILPSWRGEGEQGEQGEPGVPGAEEALALVCTSGRPFPLLQVRGALRSAGCWRRRSGGAAAALLPEELHAGPWADASRRPLAGARGGRGRRRRGARLGPRGRGAGARPHRVRRLPGPARRHCRELCAGRLVPDRRPGAAPGARLPCGGGPQEGHGAGGARCWGLLPLLLALLGMLGMLGMWGWGWAAG